MQRNAMQLRDYQQDAVNSIYAYYAQGSTGNPIVVLPTGAGKSLVIAELIRSAMQADPAQRFLMVTHVKELIAQNHEKLHALWHNAPSGIYSAGLGKKQAHKPVIFGGVQSMHKKAEVFGFRHLVIIDECHLLNNKSEGRYHELLEGLKRANPNIKVIGLSATPYRTQGGHLLNGGVFTDVCYEYPVGKLIERGYLSPVYTKIPKNAEADMSGVRTVAGEFNQAQMQEAFMRDCVTEKALQDVFSRITNHKSMLFFCAGVEHAQYTHTLLQQRGLRGAVVYDKTPPVERDKAIANLRNGAYDYLCNNAVLTTGTDIPRIDCVVLLRATKSRGLYVQMVGRGMRLYQGKTHCLLLDYGGNVDRFGTIDTQPEGKKAVDMEKEAGVAPFKVCELKNIQEGYEPCATINHAKATHCIQCLAPFIQKAPHEAHAASGDVISVKKKPDSLPVESVRYSHHIGRESGKDTLCIEYECKGNVLVREYIGQLRAIKRLDRWFGNKEHLWAKDIHELVDLCTKKATPPRAIFVKQSEYNNKYLEVVAYDFT